MLGRVLFPGSMQKPKLKREDRMNGREREGRDPGAGRFLAAVAFLFGVLGFEYQNNLESSGPLLVPSHRNNLDYMGFLLAPSGPMVGPFKKKNGPAGGDRPSGSLAGRACGVRWARRNLARRSLLFSRRSCLKT